LVSTVIKRKSSLSIEWSSSKPRVVTVSKLLLLYNYLDEIVEWKSIAWFSIVYIFVILFSLCRKNCFENKFFIYTKFLFLFILWSKTIFLVQSSDDGRLGKNIWKIMIFLNFCERKCFLRFSYFGGLTDLAYFQICQKLA
jgi:hypothetical protein